MRLQVIGPLLLAGRPLHRGLARELLWAVATGEHPDEQRLGRHLWGRSDRRWVGEQLQGLRGHLQRRWGPLLIRHEDRWQLHPQIDCDLQRLRRVSAGALPDLLATHPLALLRPLSRSDSPYADPSLPRQVRQLQQARLAGLPPPSKPPTEPGPPPLPVRLELLRGQVRLDGRPLAPASAALATTLARAGGEWLTGPELLRRWPGGGESALRKTVQRLRAHSPPGPVYNLRQAYAWDLWGWPSDLLALEYRLAWALQQAAQGRASVIPEHTELLEQPQLQPALLALRRRS